MTGAQENAPFAAFTMAETRLRARRYVRPEPKTNLSGRYGQITRRSDIISANYGLAWENACRFRNTRTAAGFEPMPSKTQPDKMLPVTFGIHKKQFFCPAPSVRGWFRNHWRKSLGGGDPTKCLAHAKQNPAPYMLPVTFGTHKHQCFCPAS